MRKNENQNPMTRNNTNRLSLRERMLMLFFGILVVLNIIHLLIGLASLPDFYRRATSQIIEPVELAGTLFISNEMVQQAAQERGLSLQAYASFQIIFNTVLVGIYGLIAAIVLWKGRRQWFAWYTAALMLFLAGYSYIDQIYAARLVPLEWLELGSLLWPLLLLYIYLFPNGQAVPRWSRAPVFILCGVHFILQASFIFAIFFPGQIDHLLNDLLRYGQNVIPINFVLILICQVLRYRKESTPVERQQTKWFLFGLFLVVLTLPLDSLLKNFVWKEEIDALSLIWLPISLAIAILQYRLWEIDLIIRRTVVYATLTGLLVLIYFGLVTILQNLLAGISGQQSPLAIVISTLAIAALFNPLRIRLQAFLDRRFYRSKYDAERALASFAQFSQVQTDLAALTSELARLADNTLQPVFTRIWLKGEDRKERMERQGQ